MRVLSVLLVLGLWVTTPVFSAYEYVASSEDPHLVRKEIKKFTKDRLQWIESELLAKRIYERGKGRDFFHLVDLRLEAAYDKKHITGAINIPGSKLRFKAEKIFSKSDPIVVYGYSAKEPTAVNAVVFLMNKGYDDIYALRGGIQDWAGPVELSKNLEL